MPSIVKPDTLHIDWSNPLTKGLVFDAPFFENAGTNTRELVNLINGTIAASGATWDRNLYGVDLDFSAAASAVNYTTPSSVNSLTNITIEILFYQRSDGGGSLGRIISKATNPSERYRIDGESDTPGQVINFAVSATTGGFWEIAQPTLNKWHHYVVTYSWSSLSNVPSIYLEGNKQSTNNSGQPTGSFVTDDTNFHIGNRSDNIRNFDGKIAYVRIWNRQLSGQEVKQLFLNQFGIYKQFKPRTFGIYM